MDHIIEVDNGQIIQRRGRRIFPGKKAAFRDDSFALRPESRKRIPSQPF